MSVRLFTYSVAASALAILLIQLSHGLTFGLFLAAVVHYIDVIAPAEHRGLFQAIAPSVFFGLGSVVGSWTGGFIVEILSVAWLFRLSAVTTLLGAALLPVLGRRTAATA
jgi:PPP family 3-phenylpropionic acid transporter